MGIVVGGGTIDERIKSNTGFSKRKHIGETFVKMRTKMVWDGDLGANMSVLAFYGISGPSSGDTHICNK